MKNFISAEFYKLRHDRLIWLVPVIYVALGFYACGFDHEIFDLYKGLELFSLSEIVRIHLPLTAAVTTGYVIGGDFSCGTIRNALSAGVSKTLYFFSRLLAELLLTTALFSVTLLIHITGRLLHPMGNTEREIAALWAKLAVYMTVLLLQLLACVSMMNAVCYFIRKRLAAVAVGMGMIYAEVILRQTLAVNGVDFYRKIAEHAPSSAIRSLFAHAAYDRVFGAEFLTYGISAAVILAVSCTAGYLKFCYDTDIQ